MVSETSKSGGPVYASKPGWISSDKYSPDKNYVFRADTFLKCEVKDGILSCGDKYSDADLQEFSANGFVGNKGVAKSGLGEYFAYIMMGVGAGVLLRAVLIAEKNGEKFFDIHSDARTYLGQLVLIGKLSPMKILELEPRAQFYSGITKIGNMPPGIGCKGLQRFAEKRMADGLTRVELVPGTPLPDFRFFAENVGEALKIEMAMFGGMLDPAKVYSQGEIDFAKAMVDGSVEFASYRGEGYPTPGSVVKKWSGFAGPADPDYQKYFDKVSAYERAAADYQASLRQVSCEPDHPLAKLELAIGKAQYQRAFEMLPDLPQQYQAVFNLENEYILGLEKSANKNLAWIQKPEKPQAKVFKIHNLRTAVVYYASLLEKHLGDPADRATNQRLDHYKSVLHDIYAGIDSEQKNRILMENSNKTTPTSYPEQSFLKAMDLERKTTLTSYSNLWILEAKVLEIVRGSSKGSAGAVASAGGVAGSIALSPEVAKTVKDAEKAGKEIKAKGKKGEKK